MCYIALLVTHHVHVCHLVICDMTHSYVTWLCCSIIYSLICYRLVGHDSFVCDVLMFLIHIIFIHIIFIHIIFIHIIFIHIIFIHILFIHIMFIHIIFIHIIFIHIIFIHIVFIHTATHHMLDCHLVICDLTHTYVTWLCCSTWHDNSAHSCANIALPVTHHMHVCQLVTCDTSSMIHTSCHRVISPTSFFCGKSPVFFGKSPENKYERDFTFDQADSVISTFNLISPTFLRYETVLHTHIFTDVCYTLICSLIYSLMCYDALPDTASPTRLPPTHVQNDSFIRVIWRVTSVWLIWHVT